MTDNEKSLWISFSNGNSKALFTMYELLYPDLIKSGLAICKDEGLVKDTINQFFLYLWDRREHLNQPFNLRPYIIISFRRMLFAELKQRGRISIGCTDEHMDAEQSKEDAIIQSQVELEMQLKVKKALDKLPKRQKQLIMMKYYENLSYEEISARTSLSTRTVYNQIYEAIKALKTEILLMIILGIR